MAMCSRRCCPGAGPTVNVDPVSDGFEFGPVTVPTGFAARTAQVRARILLEVVHGLLRRGATAARFTSAAGHEWWASSGIRVLEVQIYFGGDQSRVVAVAASIGYAFSSTVPTPRFRTKTRRLWREGLSRKW
jgi:hypothetical protein